MRSCFGSDFDSLLAGAADHIDTRFDADMLQVDFPVDFAGENDITGNDYLFGGGVIY